MNYYLTGIEGMEKMLDCSKDTLKYFKKNAYSDAFQKMYQEYVPTFDAIENGYNSVIDHTQFITNMAEALVSRAVSIVNEGKKNRIREQRLMDLNLTMAVFIFPIILNYKGNSSQPLVDKILEGWKREFPKSNLNYAPYEEIEKGFHRKFCYITTAVCESFGRSDDCYELTLLRDYRDHYLTQQPDGEEMIREYYDVAPSIVKHINRKPEAALIYRSIWETYLSPCICMIEQDEPEACRDLYREMVYTLKKEYFYQ